MKNVFRKRCLPLLVALGLGVSAQSMAHKDEARDFRGQGNQCLKIKPPELLGSRVIDGVTLTDQFAARHLVDLATKLAHDHFSTKNCQITLPVFPWTGIGVRYPTLSNLPTETIVAKSLTKDELAERLLTLAFLTTFEVADAQLGIASNDLLGAFKSGPFSPGRDVHLSKIAAILGDLYDKYDRGEVAISDAQAIALGLGANHLANLADNLADRNSEYDFSFNQTYSDYIHRYYNQLQQFAIGGNGRMVSGDYIFGASTLPFPNQIGLTPTHSKGRVPLLAYEALAKEKIVKWEAEAVGKYFWPRLYVDPKNSMIFTATGTDPDGYTRPSDFTLANYDLPGQAMRWEWLTQLSAPFRSLRVISPTRLTPTLTFESDPASLTKGIKQLINEENPGNPAAADEIINSMEVIWNTSIAPAYSQLATLAATRRLESHDDFYAGSWRAKFKKVNSVTHDANNKAISADVVLADGSQVTVPLDGSKIKDNDDDDNDHNNKKHDNNKKKVKKALKDIAEMDGWFNRNLAVAQDQRPGAKFSLLFKKDATKGICGGAATGTVAYTSPQDIIDNYGAIEQVVGVDAPLDELVYKSGFEASKFFYDIKEYLADQYVKKNPAEFGFANAAVAGVCKTNSANQLIDYAAVRNKLVDKANGSIDTSDVGVLNRHYGYNADGSVKADEWNPAQTQLKYTYQNFDFIYAQHYAVNKTKPMVASNLCENWDGTTACAEADKFYQFTKSADSAKRSAFITAFGNLETRNQTELLANKPGSYFRWKLDWVAQKISGFVIANAVSKDILTPNFVNNYFSGTFYDTNDPTGTQCGFGLAKNQPEVVSFRVVGQTSGSANSSQYKDLAGKIFNVRMSFGTLNPKSQNTIANTIGTLLHEGALGHGFDNVPNSIDEMRGIFSPASWLTNLNAGLVKPDLEIIAVNLTGPSRATLGEGWATYGEILGVGKQLNVLFDSQGCPNATAVNDLGMFLAMSSLSRIGARQVISVAENSSKYAWSIYHSLQVFRDLTDLTGVDAASFNMRFISHPTQQTTYATGLITNLGILSQLKAKAAERGANCTVNEPAFNELRITRTDYILGALLQKYIDANIDSLIKCN